jgi:UTP:GlnB (protein PII) uridylyltransferase
MRIWLPDAPGVLGAVAAEIGAVDGNVVALEVLERDAGVAIDEFVVAPPRTARTPSSTPRPPYCRRRRRRRP